MSCCLKHTGSLLLISHTKETLDVLLARPTFDTDTGLRCCNNIDQLRHHIAAFLNTRKTSFHAILVKSRVLHTTCILNPVSFCVYGGVYVVLLFSECHQVGFISLQLLLFGLGDGNLWSVVSFLF